MTNAAKRTVTRRAFMRCSACGAAVAIAAMAAGCGGARPDGPQPPEIAYGRDVCEQCGMVISEARFACATVLEDGTAHKFDDLGDMVIYHFDRPDQKVIAYFAHEYTSEAWIRAESAFYVQSDAIKSPMGHGLAAFEKAAAAEAFAKEVDGRVLDFDGMRADVHVRLHR